MSKEFNYREAGKYLANLEKEVEGKQAMLEIAKATVESKKQLEQIDSFIADQKDELERYRGLVSTAKQDAQDAEDASLLRISTASAKALAREESVQAEMDTAQDNLGIVQYESDKECERLNGEVATAMKDKDDKVIQYNQEEQDALTKRDQALQALREVGKLTGGGV